MSANEEAKYLMEFSLEVNPINPSIGPSRGPFLKIQKRGTVLILFGESSVILLRHHGSRQRTFLLIVFVGGAGETPAVQRLGRQRQ